MDNSKNDEVQVKFKKKKNISLRKRKNSSESENSDNGEAIYSKLEETKEIQKLRKRPNGVSAIGLNLGKSITVEEEAALKDPYKINSGGLINMSALKSGKIQKVDDAYDTGIGTQFSAETNKRDEDEEMMKYIEDKLSRRKGTDDTNEKKLTQDEEQETSKYLTPEEAALRSIPSYLRESSMQRSEEMLSFQMLSGIPEVDLGIEVKIKNIEATEEAKLKLLWDKNNKKDTPSQFVPTNMAVNFVQHNRFNIDEITSAKKKNVDDFTKETNVYEEPDKKKSKTEKASDDYHYEKFKKHFRKKK